MRTTETGFVHVRICHLSSSRDVDFIRVDQFHPFLSTLSLSWLWKSPYLQVRIKELKFLHTVNYLIGSMRNTSYKRVKIQVSCGLFSIFRTTVWLRLGFVLDIRIVKWCWETALVRNRTLLLQRNNWERLINIYLSSCTSPDGHVSDKATSSISEIHLIFTYMG